MKLALRKPSFSLPLLRKELVEAANRRRTYVIRTVYAVLLFVAALLFLYDMLDDSTGNPFIALGRGRELFEMIVMLQFVGVYVFLPALVCGAITSEKEANSLQLLLVTDMRPWEILISKLVGRLVPMFTFLLLGLPLLAIAYAFGGVTMESLFAAVLLLVAATLQVGSLCLMLSAWCSTTAAAFVGSYLVGLTVYFGPAVLVGILWGVFGVPLSRVDEAVIFGHVPIVMYADLNVRWGAPPAYLSVALRAAPSLVTVLVFLVVARIVFVRRALLPPKSALRSVFTFFDRIFDRANRVTGGVVLIKDRSGLPGDRPVTWLEVHQRALSKARYLIRIFVLLEIPVLVVLTLMLAFDARSGSAEGLSAVLFLVFPLAGLMACVQAAGSFAAERRRQTLDVLLTTPMTGREIVREKMAALWRLLLVLAAPLVTIVVLEAWWEHRGWHTQWSGGQQVQWMQGLPQTAGYLVTSLLCIFVYLPLVAYLSMYIGMRVRNPTRAILTAVAAVVGWVAFLPFIIILVCDAFLRGPDWVWTWSLIVSPATIVPFNEFNDLDDIMDNEVVLVVLNFALHIGLLALFRAGCLRQADRLLGRVPATSGRPPLLWAGPAAARP